MFSTFCQYEILGHSGEDFNLEFLKSEKPPKNNKDRLDVLLVRRSDSLNAEILEMIGN